MALTKVTGPLVSGSTNNLGDYTINNITGVAATFSGNLSVGGTITYQDVTSIDSVGIITAQAGIHLGIGATTGKIDVATGISTFTKVGIGTDTPSSILESRGTAATYTNAITVFTGNTTNAISGGKNGIGLYSYGDALRGGLSSNLLYSNSSTPSQSHTGRSSGEIEFVNTTTADKTSAITFGGYVKGSTTFVERIRIDNDGNIGIGTDNPSVVVEVLNDSPGLRLTDKNSSAGLLSYTQLTNINGNTYVYTRANSSNGSYLIGGQGGGTFDEFVRITSTGKVGINTTNPDHNLHVYQDAGDAVLTIESQGNNNHAALEFYRTSSAGDHKGAGSIYVTGDTSTSTATMNFGVASNISHGANPRLSIFGDGNVGIGSTIPQKRLTIRKGTGDDGGILVQPNINFAADQNRAYLVVGTDAWSGLTTSWNTYGFQHRLKTNSGGSPRLTIDSSGGERFCIENGGNVGIGTDSPSELLEIASSAACGIAIKDDNNGFAASKIKVENGGRDLTIGAPQDIYFKDIDTGTKHLYIESTGHIGIGTDNPSNALDVHGGTINTAIVARSTDAKAQVSLVDNATTGVGCVAIGAEGDELFLTSGSGGAEALRIDTAGKVGIGSTVPKLGLDINKGANSGVFLGNPIHGYQLRANVTSSHDYGLMIEDEDGNDLYRAVSSTGSSNANTHTFFTAGSERFRILANADITFTGVDTSFATIMYASNFTKLDLRGTNIANSYHYILSYGEGHAEADHFHMVNKTTNGSLVFRTGSAADERLHIKSDGKVGINASDPSTHLQIGDGTTDSDNVITLGKRVSSSETNLPKIGHHSANGASSSLALCATSSSGKIHFFTGNGGNGFGASNNAERMVITSGGAVGIATDKFYDSSTKLEVRGRINTVGSASTGSINPGNGTVVNVGSLTNHDVQLMTGNSTRVTIVQAGTSGEAMRISGVGVTVQSSLTPNFEVQTTASSGQDCRITLKGARTSSSTSSIAMIRFVNDTSSSYTMGEIVGMDPAGSHASQIGDIVFRTTHNDTTTEVARFTGGETAAGRNLKFANGSGIDFSATSNSPGANSDTSNEVLNDYERGTFDFKLEDANAGSDTLKMHYVKVGSIVHCYGPFRGTEGSTESVYWQLSGTADSNITTSCELPFLPVDSGACESPIYRNIETRENTPNNPADGDTMPVLGWRKGDSTCRLTDTRTEKSYNAYTGGDTMRKADTRTNVVLHFNFCYVTNS